MGSVKICILTFFAVLLAFPASSSADVKISLKNGRTIIADTCRETKDSLVCEKLGGTFSFHKKEIENLKEITASRTEEPAEEEEEAQAEAEAPKAGTPVSADTSASAPAPEGGVLVRGMNPDAEKRLDDIQKRKEQLRGERDNLLREQEQVREEIKKAGVVRSQDQFIKMSNRDSELKSRIDRFNAEVNALDQEESMLLKGLRK